MLALTKVATLVRGNEAAALFFVAISVVTVPAVQPLVTVSQKLIAVKACGHFPTHVRI